MIGVAGLTASLTAFGLAVVGLFVAVRSIRSGRFDPTLRWFALAIGVLASAADYVRYVGYRVDDQMSPPHLADG